MPSESGILAKEYVTGKVALAQKCVRFELCLHEQNIQVVSQTVVLLPCVSKIALLSVRGSSLFCVKSFSALVVFMQILTHTVTAEVSLINKEGPRDT